MEAQCPPSNGLFVSAPLGEWRERASRLIDELRVSLPAVERIEHIGSSAIGGMAAKDVLDIQVSVADLDVAEATFDEPLAALDFTSRPYNHDHVPAGRSDSVELWQKRFWLRRGHRGGDVNLHVRRTGSPNERLALLFRDWFRVHPEAIPAYSQIKVLLSGLATDVDTYTDIKDPVVDIVNVAAEKWATSVGWHVEPVPLTGAGRRYELRLRRYGDPSAP